uniref:Uncharacterized protein n=1 Tax=Chlamydomonas leiostraca TaxID=1034604 RepID=A0A7S0R5F6_9CHLO|mmetsp:Transcript_14383/g.35662  ORF Transcript_14383/g.35662 Transcript_14383/m.35662 type:complete len:389 (+) Transcript_14383:47-1213(+)
MQVRPTKKFVNMTSTGWRKTTECLLLVLLYNAYPRTASGSILPSDVPPVLPAKEIITYRGFKTLNTSEILMVVVATQARKTWQLQLETWMRHFPSLVITEAHVPKCTLCGDPTGEMPHLDTFFHGDRWKNMGLHWYCAQQRPLQALRDVLIQQAKKIPKWLMIVDDDTIVHPWNLMRTLTTKPADPDAMVMVGNERRGGAGFILSRAALVNLTSTIQISDMTWDHRGLVWKQEPGSTTLLDACLERLLGGNWCYMHSDHVMGLCAKSANIQVLDRNGTMAQWCPVGTMLLDPKAVGGRVNNLRDATKADTKTQSWLTDHMVSCHYMDKTAMDSIYDMIKGTWAPASPSGQQGAAPSTQEAASSSGQAAPSGAQPAKQARRLAGSSRGR